MKQHGYHPLKNGFRLFVDDVPRKFDVLFLWGKGGFKVRIARDGIDALTQVALSKPDIILLDVMMPEMGGFEACRHLKANEETGDIPNIFMVNPSDAVDKEKGFEIGAVDILTKPIRQEEQLMRINAHLTKKTIKN